MALDPVELIILAIVVVVILVVILRSRRRKRPIVTVGPPTSVVKEKEIITREVLVQYCQHCGARVTGTPSKCPNCGANL